MVIFFRLLCLFILVGLAGCANPGIVKLSPDTYMLARADRAGLFGNPAAMKAQVIQEANAFAQSMGKVAIPLAAKEVPVAVGRFATFEYQFRVVDLSDSEAKRTTLVPRADVVIDQTSRTKLDVQIKNEPATSNNFYEELVKLDDLKKRGILSQAEFETAKKRLLSK